MGGLNCRPETMAYDGWRGEGGTGGMSEEFVLPYKATKRVTNDFAESINTLNIALGVIFSAAAMALRRTHKTPLTPEITPSTNQNMRRITPPPLALSRYSCGSR